MSLFSGKTMVIAGGLATLALSFQLGVFYGPERRDALYREYSGAGRVAAVAALRPAIARIAETAFPQAQAAGFVEASPSKPEVRGEYGRPLTASAPQTCEGVAPAFLAEDAAPSPEPDAPPVLAIGADADVGRQG